MADEIETSIPTPAGLPAAESVSSPAELPVTPSPENSPAVEPIAPEVIPVETPVEPAIEESKAETLLGGEKKIEEKSVEEAKPEGKSEEKPAEESKEVELPTYEPFTLPEGVTLDAEKMGEYTTALAEFEATTKASHEEVQKLGQQFLDRHIAELQRYTETLTHAWNKQKNDWKESFLKDPEFTNRTNTVVNAAIDAIGVYAGNSEQQGEFRKLMEDTGVGNHPAMIRMLSNMMLARPEPKPLAAPQIASGQKASKMSKMYGNKS